MVVARPKLVTENTPVELLFDAAADRNVPWSCTGSATNIVAQFVAEITIMCPHQVVAWSSDAPPFTTGSSISSAVATHGFSFLRHNICPSANGDWRQQ